MSKCPKCFGEGGKEYWGFDADCHFAECSVCHGTGRLQPFASVKILRVWYQCLGTMTERECRAEGYGNLNEYLNALWAINRKQLHPKMERQQLHGRWVWAVEFELVEAGRG
jgi:hypothetical protein